MFRVTAASTLLFLSSVAWAPAGAASCHRDLDEAWVDALGRPCAARTVTIDPGSVVVCPVPCTVIVPRHRREFRSGAADVALTPRVTTDLAPVTTAGMLDRMGTPLSHRR
jgi:hypothetical protein